MPFGKPLQLLHVDDSATLRKTVERGLEPYKETYILTQASSVDEAWALITSGKKFDLILTDWLMGGKSGLDLLCAVKTHPSYHHLPVFFLTSEYDNTSLVTAVTFGAGGLLKKPASGPEIYAYLEKKVEYIKESLQASDTPFLAEAKPLLENLQSLLPLKDVTGMQSCLQAIQSLKSKAMAARWPLLADYSQRMDDALQATIKKNAAALNPLSILMKEYQAFTTNALMELESGRPHQAISATTEGNLKNYMKYLEAGWFA